MGIFLLYLRRMITTVTLIVGKTMRYTFSISLFLSLALGSGVALADAPDGYYDACNGKSKSALKSQLYSIVKNHTALSYSKGTWEAFRHTDVDPAGEYWMDIYTHEQVPVTTTSGMNVEHTFPKSWWGGANNDAYKDIVHLMPVNQWANNDRSNHPFGEVDPAKVKNPNYRCPSPNYTLGGPVAGQGGGAGYVFEPADEFKGDMARTYFYMVTCYQDLTWSADGLRTAAQGTYPTLQPWALEMLLRWHREDPVSDKERDRNDGVYERQRNRNPFIDHPEMVEHIWGNLMETPWGDGTVTPPQPDVPVLTAPLNGDVTIFESTGPGQASTHIVPVLGSGFTHNLRAAISGRNASLFSMMIGSTPVQAITLSAQDVNSEAGVELMVRYLPEEATIAEAYDNAVLTISGADLKEDVTVELSGSCAQTSIRLPGVELDASARFFSLDGRVLPARPAAPGIYIVVCSGQTHKFTVR